MNWYDTIRLSGFSDQNINGVYHYSYMANGKPVFKKDEHFYLYYAASFGPYTNTAGYYIVEKIFSQGTVPVEKVRYFTNTTVMDVTNVASAIWIGMNDGSADNAGAGEGEYYIESTSSSSSSSISSSSSSSKSSGSSNSSSSNSSSSISSSSNSSSSSSSSSSTQGRTTSSSSNSSSSSSSSNSSSSSSNSSSSSSSSNSSSSSSLSSNSSSSNSSSSKSSNSSSSSSSTQGRTSSSSSSSSYSSNSSSSQSKEVLVRVSAGGTPNVSGDYVDYGTSHGQQYYIREDGEYYIWFAGTKWNITSTPATALSPSTYTFQYHLGVEGPLPASAVFPAKTGWSGSVTVTNLE